MNRLLIWRVGKYFIAFIKILNNTQVSKLFCYQHGPWKTIYKQTNADQRQLKSRAQKKTNSICNRIKMHSLIIDIIKLHICVHI